MDSLSPESTVTSLMSNTGCLRSRSSSSSIRYRDKDYVSASAALDAYIADFERSCQKCGSAGQLLLPRAPCTASTFRNRDVLRESLTETELDFLNLPISADRDRLSMTTDELLSIPSDGSMPVTRTSALTQGVPGRRNCARLGCSFTNPQRNQQQPGPAWASLTRGRGAATVKSPDKIWHGGWFTSGWDERNRPAWIQGGARSELPLPVEPELLGGRTARRTRAPSWVAELEANDHDQTQSQVTAERRSSDIMDSHRTFRDDRVERLMQEAKRVLSSLSQSCDVNDQKSPASSSCCSSLARGPSAGGDPGDLWEQPGPVEALKQMLFRLQAVETKLQQRGGGEPDPDRLQAETQVAEAEWDSVSCGPSLHR